MARILSPLPDSQNMRNASGAGQLIRNLLSNVDRIGESALSGIRGVLSGGEIIRPKKDRGVDWSFEVQRQPQQQEQVNQARDIIPNRFSNIVSQPPPEDFTGVIVDAANQYGINPDILAAILFQESRYNPQALNPGGYSDSGEFLGRDRGIAQLNEFAFPDVTDEQAFDPNFAIPFAAQILANNLERFGGDFNRAIAAYNVGPGGASIQGPERFGGGPRGQTYLDNVVRNLSDQLIQELGLLPSENFR